MNRYSIICAALLIAAGFSSCQEENVNQPDIKGREIRILAEHDQLSWTAVDSISVFDGLSNIPYHAVSAGDTVEFASSAPMNDDVEEIYALHPYSCDAYRVESGVRTHLLNVQDVTRQSVDSLSRISFAFTKYLDETTTLSFKDICSFFKFSLNAEDHIRKVTLSAGEGEWLAGEIELGYSDKEPEAVVVDGISQVMLVSSEDMDGVYVACVLPSVLQNGLTVTLESAEGEIRTKKIVAKNADGLESALVFVRGRINRNPIVVDKPFIEVVETCWMNGNTDSYASGILENLWI